MPGIQTRQPRRLILLVDFMPPLAGSVLTSRHGCTKDNLEKEAKCVDHCCKGEAQLSEPKHCWVVKCLRGTCVQERERQRYNREKRIPKHLQPQRGHPCTPQLLRSGSVGMWEHVKRERQTSTHHEKPPSDIAFPLRM